MNTKDNIKLSMKELSTIGLAILALMVIIVLVFIFIIGLANVIVALGGTV